MKTDTSVRRRESSRRGRKVNALTFSIMVKLLYEGTRTCTELADDTGLHKLTVYDWTREMHRQGIIHICMWDGEGRSSVRIFKMGPGKDAVRPVKTREQIHAEYKARQKAKQLLHRMAGELESV
jgi:DNA-binding Lrp family transcriptional regulator